MALLQTLTSLTLWALIVPYSRALSPPTDCRGPPTLLTLDDYEKAAMNKLPKNLADYLQLGTGSHSTLSRNYEYMKKVQVIPRYLRYVDDANLTTTVFDRDLDMPIGIAPSGIHKRWTPLGELATLRAAASHNVIYIISSATSVNLEDLVDPALNQILPELWLQLFLMPNKDVQYDLMKRAEDIGVGALVFSVDMPVSSLRYHNIRNEHKELHSYAMTEQYKTKTNSTKSLFVNRGTQTWTDLEDAVRRTSLPVVVKGVLTPEDAVLAKEAGAKGIIVSNHGGRQLDGTISSIEALDAITKAMPNAKKEGFGIFFDGGIRSGLDAFRAIGLGAQYVFVGRAAAYGLAAGGQEGLEGVLDIFHDEFKTTMQQAGFRSVDSITRDAVRTSFSA